MKAVLIAGEKSGDLIAGEIAFELKNKGFEIFGVGGESALENGLKESFFPISEISVMGFAEVLPKAFKIKKLIRETAKKILEINPEFVLTIDSPGFSTRLVSLLKKHEFKGKIFHAVAPTVWAYKPKRAKKFAKLYDKIFCILPFEPPFFEREGLPASYICYPPYFRLKNEIEDAKNYQKEFILLSLGSRENEIKNHIDFGKETIELIKKEIPDSKFVLLTFSEFEKLLKQEFPNEIISCTAKEKLLFTKKAKFAISKSGTGAVESSLFSIPSVIFYKANFISYFIIKMFAKIKFANLINILENKEIIPEFIQFNAKPENIAKASIKILTDKSLQQIQIEGIKKAISKLESPKYSSFGKGVVNEIIEIIEFL